MLICDQKRNIIPSLILILILKILNIEMCKPITDKNKDNLRRKKKKEK